MKFLHLILVTLLSAALATGAAYYISRANPSHRPAKETRLEQVKRTGVIRCGYGVFPPFIIKDPNTGKMSGIVHDLVEEIGRQLNLKIEWKTEISLGQMLADLKLNRYDMVCLGLFETPFRAREGDFTAPFLYLPLTLYVRKDDNRFDQDFARANKPDVTFAALDGEFSSIAASENFPAAKKLDMPQLTGSADYLMAVATRKADAVITDSITFADYETTNPGVIRAARGKPLRVLAMGLPLPADEPAFKAMLDTTIAYLHDSGFIDKLLKKYQGHAITFRVAKPYAEEKETTP